MESTKPWYLSRTIWASLVMIGTVAAGMFGVPADAIDGAALTDMILQLVAAIAGIVAILGRISATAKIR